MRGLGFHVYHFFSPVLSLLSACVAEAFAHINFNFFLDLNHFQLKCLCFSVGLIIDSAQRSRMQERRGKREN